jgi:hypothetical protein
MEYNIILRIKIKDTWQDKSQYVQLPITITKTLDESLDLGEVVLNFTPDSEEYEAYSDVDLQVSADGSISSYFMIIQKDVIEEQTIGTRSYYKHKITLIEGTHKMSTVIVNDFSITQPIDAVLPYVSVQKEKDVVRKANPFSGSTFANFWSKNFREVGGAIKETGYRTYVAPVPEIYGNAVHKYPAVYDFKLNLGDYLISPSYSSVAKQIYLPEFPEGTFTFGTLGTVSYTNNVLLGGPSNDFTFNNQVYKASSTLKLNIVEELIDITDPNLPVNVTTAISNRRIDLTALQVDHSYKLVIRTKTPNLDSESYWEHPDNSFAPIYMAISSHRSLGEPETIVNARPIDILTLLSKPAGSTYSTVRGYDSTVVGTYSIQATSDQELFRYEYLFSIVSQAVSDSKYTVFDVIQKAINHIEPRKLLDSRYYNQTTDPELTDGATLIAVPNDAAKLLPSIYVSGDISDKTVGDTYKLYYPNTSSWIAWTVASGIDDGIVNLSNYDSNLQSSTYYTQKQKFSINPNLKEKTIVIPSLDFSFAGGKNLLEVMFEIGKLFDGIPRLSLETDGSYSVDFDILDDLPDNELFEDGTNIFVKESNTDNYATGLVSQLENAMVDDEDVNRSSNTSFYPGSQAWIRFRTDNYEDTVLKLISGESTTDPVIAIDDPNIGIYKLIDIKVRNVNAATSSGGQDYLTGISLKDYVVEKTIFETLPFTPAAKGLAMFYEKDGNKIYNAMKIYDRDSVLNFSGTTRVLQDILVDILGVALNTSSYPFLRYEFKLEYIPTMLKTRVVSEQSTITKESTGVYNSFSQGERNISLSQYGQAADRILKRTGINNINKVYMITNPSTLPVIGEKIVSGGYSYYADSITIVFHNNHIQCAVSYSKNINKINKFVGFNKNYREYSIFKDDIVWKRMNINDYAYIDTQAYTTNTFDPKKLDFYRSIRTLFTNDEPTLQKLEAAVYVVKNLDGQREERGRDTDFDGDIDVYDQLDAVITKLVGSHSNNSLIFTSSMFDNFSAGRTLADMYIVNSNPPVLDPNRRGQIDVPYCNELGRADVLEMMLLKSSDATSDVDSYPKLPENVLSTKRANAVFRETFFVNKDNKDALQMIYQLHFQSRNKDIEIRSSLLRFNRLVSANIEAITGKIIAVGIQDIDAIKNKRIYDYDSADILNPSYYSIPSINVNTGVMNIPGFSFTSTKNYEGYAWVFENSGDIALIHTLPIAQGSASIPTIYFNFTEERLGAVQS